ncbi:helix-turn-helix domain-containing protein [Cryobacterium sp. Hz9]|nr:helix-turn-helix domain-containing protein [Cryobacterium sp. Hz9]
MYSPYDGRVQLSVKEDELLELLADAPQRTFSDQQILQTGFSPAATAGTVETCVHYLRRKTDMDIVLTVRGEDYRLGQP